MPSLPVVSALRGAFDIATMLRFATVGLVTTCLDIGVFAALGAAGLPPVPANILSYSCGIALSYALNRRWTFGEKGSFLLAVKFSLATVSGLLLSTVLLALLSMLVWPLVAKLLTLPVVFLWNYYSTRLWVFPVDTRRDLEAGTRCD